jgi:hypothetical protein
MFYFQKLFELFHMVFPKVVDHVLSDLLNFLFGQFTKHMHDIAFLFLGVPQMFWLIFRMCKKVFTLVKERICHEELFVLELLNFYDLL